MPGCWHVRVAAATTAVHGGLSERLLTTRKLNPTTTARSSANTATGAQAWTLAGASPPGGSPSGPPGGGTSPATPRGRSMATIAVYKSSAGAMTYRGCTMGRLSTISPTNSSTLNTRAVTASGQAGAVRPVSATTTTRTTIAHAPQIRASCTAISGMRSGMG